MTKKLVIVESPAKARTLSRFLGSGYSIKASLGHIRDLPKSQLGVDVANGFEPKYVVPRSKYPTVKELKTAAQKATSIYLATDPDREGEAISWHLVEAAGLDGKAIHRVVFHEITPEAVKEAFRHPHPIDMDLVYAQQARRILDRLVGYKLSPLLWRKVRGGLSAGRVQSAALCMVVDREKEIESFVAQEYWSIEAELARKVPPQASFRARLVALADGTKIEIPSQEEAQRLVSELEKASYKVKGITRKEQPRNPSPPFITSTLQQEAWRKLGFAAERTMAIAQQLYEGLPIGEEGSVGLITYMRTDSTRLAATALAEARDFITEKYGADYHHSRQFTRKVKGAQEAHEAIRPTRIHREPAQVKAYLSRDQFRLYELIWKRMIASQMAAARFLNTTVNIEAKKPASRKAYLLRAGTSTLQFPGFLLLYSEGRDEEEPSQPALPELTQGEKLELRGLFPEQHFTQPPPRYTEATLIKALEENGIGRPSTYAPILSILRKREYVHKLNGHFQPQELGRLVADLLTLHFPQIVDPGFTAQMETRLDGIAGGKLGWQQVLEDFYTPFEATLHKASKEMEKIKPPDELTGELCPKCGKPLVIKRGRFGKFLACSGYPECRHTQPYLIKTGVTCPECGGELVERMSKKGRTFYGCANYPKCRFTSSRRPSPQPCPRCGCLLVHSGQKSLKCLKCDYKGPVPEAEPVGAAGAKS